MIGLVPDNFFLFQIEAAHAPVGRRVVDAVRLQVSREAAQTFLEDRDVDAPYEFVAVVNIEYEDSRSGTPAFLRAVGRAEVEIAFCFTLADCERCRDEKQSCQ